MIAFPTITAETITAHKLKNLESYLSDPMKDKISQIAALQSESICVIGNTQDLDTLCKSSALLNKNVTRILTTNQDDKLWGIPVESVTPDTHIEEQVVLVLDGNLQHQLEEQGKLRAKVMI